MASENISDPPSGFREKIKWLGPGFLWMVSAAGSGELLFTPRIGALYGYTLIWALLSAVMLKWFVNREVGRYTVCTGATVIDGFAQLPGPKNWALWLILVPQIFVAVATIAGLAGSAATALIIALPGDIRIWTIASIVSAALLVIVGRFKAVEKVATVLAIALGTAAIVAAATVFSNHEDFVAGFRPTVPPDVKYEEILPWLGFMLSGAAGLIWYSYWIQKKGYGAKNTTAPKKKMRHTASEKEKLRGWIRQMTLDNSVAVIGTLIITISFLILGTELLKPRGLIPEEQKVAEVLGQLLGQVWGPIGFWFMIGAVFVGFWDTVLSDQDGFGRMFAGGSQRLLHRFHNRKWFNEKTLRRFFVISLVTVIPIGLYLVVGEPVALLKLAGAIEAAHIPVLVALILYLNHTSLDDALKPGWLATIITGLAGVFFAVFAFLYIRQLL